MGTTFVGIGDVGFWMSDGLLELWLRLLALHVEEPTEAGSVGAGIRNNWLLASRGYFQGCIPDGLEDAASTPEGEALVRAAIHSLQDALAAAPSHLDFGVLNLLGITGGCFTADIETRRLIEVGQAFLDLIDGKITTGPNDSSFMPGWVTPERD